MSFGEEKGDAIYRLSTVYWTQSSQSCESILWCGAKLVDYRRQACSGSPTERLHHPPGKAASASLPSLVISL